MSDQPFAFVVVSRAGVELMRAPVVDPVHGVVSIGFDRENTLVVRGRGISRQHLRIIARDSALVAVDLKSLHGSFVNGVRINGPVVLHEGDRVTLPATLPFLWLVRPSRPRADDFLVVVEWVKPATP